jgi:4-hydroxyphenylpyruvate dioxygenase
MTWSRNCRVFPYEGILPLAPCVKAVFDTGFRGWVSMEVFHTELSSSDVDVPLEWARRGMQSWDRIKSAYEW